MRDARLQRRRRNPRARKPGASSSWPGARSYGWLAQVALARATLLIWLDIPWEMCRDGLLARGLRRRMTLDDQRDLLAWAQDYRTRTTSSSFAGHRRIHDAFGGERSACARATRLRLSCPDRPEQAELPREKNGAAPHSQWESGSRA